MSRTFCVLREHFCILRAFFKKVNPLYQIISIPLRDVQCTPPAARCDRCGDELYYFDPYTVAGGRIFCTACSAREELYTA